MKTNPVRINILFMIIPLGLVILNILFGKDLGPVYLSCFDPAYNYLLNGLSLAMGEMEIGHIDHPGTPVQLLCALIIRLVYFFNTDKSLTNAVLSNPEKYILAISCVFIFLNTIILFILAKSVYKHTGSVNTGIIMQLSVLFSLTSVYTIKSIGCESVLLMLSVLLVCMAFSYTYSGKSNQHSVLWFALIIAFCLTVKISAAPLLLLPVFILKGFRNKLKFFGLLLLFISIILIPIYNKLYHFLNFITGIFTHLGNYGKGQAGLINLEDYFNNLIHIFSEEIPFTLFYFFILLSGILCISKARHFKQASISDKKLLLGICVVLTVQILIVARHYSYHYLLPAYSLMVLGIYTIYHILKDNLLIKVKIDNKLFSLIVWTLVIVLFFRSIVYFNFFKGLKNPVYQTIEFLHHSTVKAKVLLADRYKESAFPEQALYFGTSYCATRKTVYRNVLKEQFPDTYFYATDEDICSWDKNLMKEELMIKYPQILLYVKYISDIQRDDFIANYLKLKIPDSLFQCSEVFNNPASHEKIFLLKSDTARIKNLLYPKLTIQCDMETISNDTLKFISPDGAHCFEKANLRNSQTYHTKGHSIKLNPESCYGCDIQLRAKEGNFFRIQIWRYQHSPQGLIVASSPSGFYKTGESCIQKNPDGWELIELAFYIPQHFQDEHITLYLWNNGKGDIYFDDLSIAIFD